MEMTHFPSLNLLNFRNPPHWLPSRSVRATARNRYNPGGFVPQAGGGQGSYSSYGQTSAGYGGPGRGLSRKETSAEVRPFLFYPYDEVRGIEHLNRHTGLETKTEDQPKESSNEESQTHERYALESCLIIRLIGIEILSSSTSGRTGNYIAEFPVPTAVKNANLSSNPRTSSLSALLLGNQM